MKTKREEIKLALPQGVTVEKVAPEIELVLRIRNKWLPVAKNLETLTGTDKIVVDLGDLTDMPRVNARAKVQAIRSGIRKAWKDLGHKPDQVRIAQLSNKLYVWANGV